MDLDGDTGYMDEANVQRGVIEDLFSYWAAKNDPKALMDMFNELATWVDNSLDMYKVSFIVIMIWAGIHF